MPHLQALGDKFKTERVDIVVVDVRNLKEQTQKAMQEASYTLPVLLDDKEVGSKTYGVAATPTTYIIDRAGRMIFKHIGYDPGMETMLEREVELLIQRKTA